MRVIMDRAQNRVADFLLDPRVTPLRTFENYTLQF